MQPRLANVLLFIAAAALARPAHAADAAPDAPAPAHAEGLVVLDYQSIPVRGYPSIDLAGVHVLNRFNDWLYGGVGAHAPLVKGAYGGFMSFDATLHAQADVAGRLYADGGVSFGGGGGGNSVSQSRVISGSGAFTKVYAGLGWHFDDFSAGLNVSHLRFSQSVIRGTQVDFAVQVPFSYAVAPYASAGHATTGTPAADDDTLMLGLDNFIQIKPKGTFRNAVNLADVQFNHFLGDNAYALVEGSVGYRGLPIYNQLLGGVGYRAALSRDVNVYGQVAVGSGGYDPQQFDTGPGLLVYPKVFGEYRFGDHLGLALSAGYLFAPRGTSRNLTLGAALNYHLTGRGGAGGGGGEGVDHGYRIDVFEQSELHPKIGDRTQGVLRLITTQVDDVLSQNVYVPIQASVATSRYLGYPGYGEVLTGLGLQTTHTPDGTFQAFAQLVAGINVHGVIAKPAIGLNVGLSDRLAVYAQVGRTTSINVAHLYPERYRFSATHIGLGLTYRFSLPG